MHTALGPEEPVTSPREVHKWASDFPASRADLPSPHTEPKNQEPVYRGQPVRGHSWRKSPLIRSLAKGLKGHPLVAITKLLPADYTLGEGKAIPEMFVDKIIYHHFLVYSVIFSFLFH